MKTSLNAAFFAAVMMGISPCFSAEEIDQKALVSSISEVAKVASTDQVVEAVKASVKKVGVDSSAAMAIVRAAVMSSSDKVKTYTAICNALDTNTLKSLQDKGIITLGNEIGVEVFGASGNVSKNHVEQVRIIGKPDFVKPAPQAPDVSRN